MTKDAFFLEICNCSINVATEHSINEIADVKAANKTSKKNTRPIKPPNWSESNTLGIVINIKEAPAFKLSFPEKAKTAGIIINPARKAIKVSMISTCEIAFSISTSFFI